MQPLGTVQLIKDQNAVLIEEKINELIKSGKYTSISDIKFKNRSFKDFCMNENFKPIYREFSTIFTNIDYINLLEKMQDKEKLMGKVDSEIKKTSINGNNFVDSLVQNEKESNETINALASTSNNINDLAALNNAKKHIAPIATFKKKEDIDVTTLSQEELKNYKDIQNATNDNNVFIYHDENGNMTNIVKDEENNYSTIDKINGENQMINHSSKSNSKGEIAKQKVLSKHTTNTPPNISAAFTNTLILSFIIGSFFGVIFLAIYLKVMH